MTNSDLELIERENEVVIQADIVHKANIGIKPRQLSDEQILYDTENFTGY